MSYMEVRIKHQIELARKFDLDNPLGLILRTDHLGMHESVLLHEAEQERWFTRFEGVIRFATTFALSFAVLFAMFNYQAYSTILSSWVTASLYGQDALVQQRPQASGLPYVSLNEQRSVTETQLVVALPVTAPDFRLEVPGVYDGSVPVVESDPSLLDARDWVNFEGQIQEDLRRGLVHYPYTAMPGQVGNVFITGHSSYYPWDPGRYKSIFALLPNIEPGTIVTASYNGKDYQYRVTRKYEVYPNAVDVLKQPQDKKMLTLMTCTPIGTTLKRLIVEAEMI